MKGEANHQFCQTPTAFGFRVEYVGVQKALSPALSHEIEVSQGFSSCLGSGVNPQTQVQNPKYQKP